MEKGDVAFAIVGIAIILLLVGGVSAIVNGFVQEQNQYKDSIKEEVVTIQSVSPAPGLSPNSFGQLMVDNAEQLMFYTTDGVGFQNTEDELMGKYETRDLLVNLKIGGTYKIKYVGWRDGQNSKFPNILSITEVKDESKAVEFSWNDYLGDWNIKNTDLFNIKNYQFIDGKMIFVGKNSTINIDAYKNQTAQNKIISDAEAAND